MSGKHSLECTFTNDSKPTPVIGVLDGTGTMHALPEFYKEFLAPFAPENFLWVTQKRFEKTEMEETYHVLTFVDGRRAFNIDPVGVIMWNIDDPKGSTLLVTHTGEHRPMRKIKVTPEEMSRVCIENFKRLDEM